MISPLFPPPSSREMGTDVLHCRSADQPRKKLGEFIVIFFFFLIIPSWFSRWCCEYHFRMKNAQFGLYFTFPSAAASTGFLVEREWENRVKDGVAEGAVWLPHPAWC